MVIIITKLIESKQCYKKYTYHSVITSYNIFNSLLRESNFRLA